MYALEARFMGRAPCEAPVDQRDPCAHGVVVREPHSWGSCRTGGEAFAIHWQSLVRDSVGSLRKYGVTTGSDLLEDGSFDYEGLKGPE